jgi:hypothetical protein
MRTEFRLILHTLPSGEGIYRIHELALNENDDIVKVSDAITPQHESSEVLTHILIHMLGALTKPVVDGKLLFSNNISSSIDTAFELMKSTKNV